MDYVDLIDQREEQYSAQSSRDFPGETKLIDWGLELLLQAFSELMAAGLGSAESARTRAAIHVQARVISVFRALRWLARVGYWQEVLILERVAWEMIQRFEIYSKDEAKAKAYLEDRDNMWPRDLRKAIAAGDDDRLRQITDLYRDFSRFPHGKVIADASADELLRPPPEVEVRKLLLSVCRFILSLLSLLTEAYREEHAFSDKWKMERAAWSLLWDKTLWGANIPSVSGESGED